MQRETAPSGIKEDIMSQQNDKKRSKQVRIDYDFHKSLRIEAAKKNQTIKKLLEEKAGWETPPPISKTNHQG